MAIPPFGSPPTPIATLVRLGKIMLGGDLGGTASAPLVLKLNGVALSGTPSSGQTLVASGPSAAAWATLPTSASETFAFFNGIS